MLRWAAGILADRAGAVSGPAATFCGPAERCAGTGAPRTRPARERGSSVAHRPEVHVRSYPGLREGQVGGDRCGVSVTLPGPLRRSLAAAAGRGAVAGRVAVSCGAVTAASIRPGSATTSESWAGCGGMIWGFASVAPAPPTLRIVTGHGGGRHRAAEPGYPPAAATPVGPEVVAGDSRHASPPRTTEREALWAIAAVQRLVDVITAAVERLPSVMPAAAPPSGGAAGHPRGRPEGESGATAGPSRGGPPQ